MEQVNDGCCRLIRWSELQHNLPPNLKISPIAAIPHKSRDYRMILDLSFQLQMPTDPTTVLPSVNQSTQSVAPQHAMYELGNVVPQLIWLMATAPRTSPILFAKVDLKDGFWRMFIPPDQQWNFAYVLPTPEPDPDPWIVVPGVLQMGWTDSPPYFCTATETVRDSVPTYLACPTIEPHPLENIMLGDPIPEHCPAVPPTALIRHLEVYMDDFIAAAQLTNHLQLRQFSRAILHAIHDVFPPPSRTNSTMPDPISLTKLRQEGVWSTTKEILGWHFDGTTRTISITPEKANKIKHKLNSIATMTRVRVKALEEIHGSLQHLAQALPLGKPTLSMLSSYIRSLTTLNKHWITPPDSIKQLLRDWIAFIQLQQMKPLDVRQLVPQTPSTWGCCDASGWGIGGVWFSLTADFPPVVWFVQWPDDIRNQLKTRDNPSGSFSMALFEMAGFFFHWLVLEHLQPSLEHHTAKIWCDNMATVSWATKLRSGTDPIAARILRVLAYRINATGASPFLTEYINTATNKMADMASREHSPDPATFLTEFNLAFPPPSQTDSWTLFLPSTDLLHKFFSLLQHQQWKLVSWHRLPKTDAAFGTLGAPSSPHLAPTCPRIFHQYPTLNALPFWEPLPHTYGQDTIPPPDRKFQLKQCKWHYKPSPRPSNWQENLHRWSQRKAPISRPLPNNWRDTDGPTHHPCPN